MKKLDVVCKEIREIFSKKNWTWRCESTTPSPKEIREMIRWLIRCVTSNGKTWSSGRLIVSQVKFDLYGIKVEGTKYYETIRVRRQK